MNPPQCQLVIRSSHIELPDRIPLGHFVNETATHAVDILALKEAPAGPVIKIVTALPVCIVVKFDGVRESHLEKVDEADEYVSLHRAVHKEHRVIVVIKPESIALDDLDIRVAPGPAARNRDYLRIDLDARNPAAAALADEVSNGSPFSAADVNERIIGCQLEALEHNIKTGIRRGLAACRTNILAKWRRYEYAKFLSADPHVPSVIKGTRDLIGQRNKRVYQLSSNPSTSV